MPQRGLFHAAKAFLAVERDDLGDRQTVLRLDLLVELDETPADPFRQHLAEGGFAGAAQADQRDARKRSPPLRREAFAGEDVLGLRDLVRRGLSQQVANDRPIGCGLGDGNEIFQMRAHRVRYPAQQHDGDVALAAFKLRDVALGNAGHSGEHFSRHAAKRAHGADTLSELLEKAGLGIGLFAHVPCSVVARTRLVSAAAPAVFF